ncbi:MAG: class I SAM-dependent methyltransferase [Dehalococcoidales bacterium]|nr:MAG: class I SAM-dependent methyltransferase [Dehalococcoidales bacterium]
MGEISPDFPEYDNQTAKVWDQLAEWWDDKIGDGNDFQNYLIEPATERLLALQSGEKVLDIACGAGRFTRRMAALGASLTAIDHSEKFIKRARERTTENADRIEYLVLSATDPSALASLGQARFDAAVCTMALMDMSSIEPLISTLPKLLKPGGRFVFSVTHPVFNSGSSHMVAEQHQQDGKIVISYGVTITDYARPYAYMGLGIYGQPVPQYYFHRPISLLFNTCFNHGFALDGLEEPTLPEELKGQSRILLSFDNMPTMPPVLVARMVLK